MNTNQITKLEKEFDPDTLALLQSIRSNIVERNGAAIGEFYYYKFGADFYRIYALALDYADKRKIPVNVALGYTLHRLKILRHGLHANKVYALDKLEELQGGNFSKRNLRVHIELESVENKLPIDSIETVNNCLNVQALLKNLFLDYSYARRSKIIRAMIENFKNKKTILSKDQLYRIARRLESITNAKTRIKPELLAVIFERNIEFIGALV